MRGATRPITQLELPLDYLIPLDLDADPAGHDQAGQTIGLLDSIFPIKCIYRSSRIYDASRILENARAEMHTGCCSVSVLYRPRSLSDS